MYLHPTYAARPERKSFGVLDAWTWVRNATGKIGHSLGAGVEENCRWKRQRSRLTDTVVNGKSNYSLMS